MIFQFVFEGEVWIVLLQNLTEGTPRGRLRAAITNAQPKNLNSTALHAP